MNSSAGEAQIEPEAMRSASRSLRATQIAVPRLLLIFCSSTPGNLMFKNALATTCDGNWYDPSAISMAGQIRA